MKISFAIIGLIGWFLSNVVVATENPEENFIKLEPDVTQSTILVNIATTMLQLKPIPAEILHSAQGIIIIPKLTTAGLLVTASKGDGMAIVRQGQQWSNPILITLASAGAGLKAGFKSGSIILIFTRRKDLDILLAGNFKLGAGWTMAVGTNRLVAEANNLVSSTIYDYSDELGLFFGVGIEGTSIHINAVTNEGLYGRNLNLTTLLTQPISPLIDIAKDAVNNLKLWLTVKTN